MNDVPRQLSVPGIERVSTIELFLDLVFVFAITQLTSLIAHPHGPGDYARTLLVFLTLMWIYGGYTWLTSNLAIERAWQRQVFFGAMAGFFVMAMAIPDVFDGGGLPYALGLLGVTAIHAFLFKTASTTSARAIVGIAGYNVTSALLVLAAAFVRPPWDWPLWAAAVAVLLLASLKGREQGFDLSPAHFVERNGLLVIVALGESVVAVGLAASELPLDPPLILTAIAALFLSAEIWWSYFDRDDRRAEHRFTHATPTERARMALYGFGYAHMAMIAGIVLLAAGLEVGIAHPLGHPEAIGIGNLAAGLALYLVGDTLYRRVLRIGSGRLRLAIAALALASIPLGLALGALAQIVFCAAIMQLLWLELRQERTHAATPRADRAPATE